MEICRERLEMLKEIMAIQFSLVDLNLYLDTHPMDQKALTLYNQYVCKFKELQKEYEEKFTMLLPMSESGCPWEWIEDPWPWEIDYKMGGK